MKLALAGVTFMLALVIGNLKNSHGYTEEEFSKIAAAAKGNAGNGLR